MSKRMKAKKGKVPKLTEAEYAEYIASLKTSDNAIQTMPKEENATSFKQQKGEEK